MTLPPLPPRRFCIPTHLIVDPQLPPAVFLTWLQLRSLTWRGQQTFTFSLQDWADLTGTSRTTFLRHLDLLQQKHALRWHSLRSGVVHVSFAGAPFPSRAARKSPVKGVPRLAPPKMGHPKMDGLQPVPPKMGYPKMGDFSKLLNHPPTSTPQPSSIPVIEPGAAESSTPENNRVEVVGGIPDSRNLESPLLTLNPPTSPNPGFKLNQDFKDLNQILGIEVEGGGEREFEGERGLSESGILAFENPALPLRLVDPAELYASLLPFPLTPSQSHLLHLEVTDPALWQRTLQHWRTHHPKHKDLLALLSLYKLGDPSACPICHPLAAPTE
jgi:hypothetical protein